MSKAYWIARIDVHDPETYKKYLEAARPAYERHHAKFLARGGRSEALDGTARARNVIIEFPSMEDAQACFASPEYAAAREFRLAASTGEVILVEGAE